MAASERTRLATKAALTDTQASQLSGADLARRALIATSGLTAAQAATLDAAALIARGASA